MANFNSKGVSLDNLPKTRREQFGFIFKNEFFTVFMIGVILFLSSLLLIGFIFLKEQFSVTIVENILQKELGKEEILFSDLIINVISFFILIIPFGILAFGISGSYRIFRNLVFNDGILFKSDFMRGVKLNFKQTFGSLIILDALLLVLKFIKFLVFFYCNEGVAQFISFILPILFIINIITEITYLCFNTFYNTKVFSSLFASFLFILRKFPINLIFGLIFGGLYFFIIKSNLIVNAIVLLMFLLLILPFYLLINLLYNVSIFDKEINDEHPEIKNKGLYIADSIEK